MELLNNTDLSDMGSCSSELWKTFKSVLEKARDMTNKEKILDMAFIAFRDKCLEYLDKPFYGYAIRYAQDLITEIERMCYPGKPRPEITQNIKRMTLTDFAEYMKNPTPGDMVTVMDEDGGILSRIKVRTVIDT